MVMRRSMLMRLGVYGALGSIILLSIMLKQYIIRRERAVQAVTVYSEWQRNGIPVEALTVHKRNVPVFTKFTMFAQEDHVSHAFVSRDVKDQLAPDQKVYAEPHAASRLLGTITDVRDEIDLDTGLFRVAIQYSGERMDSDARMIVYAETAILPQVIYIPPDCIDLRQGQPVIFKVAENRVRIQPVTFGHVDAEGMVVAAGVSDEDVVLIKGQTRVEAGDVVHIIKGDEQ